MADITHLQGVVGAASAAAVTPGSTLGVRLSRLGAFMVAPVSARFQEAVLRGNCYAVANQAGVTSQAGLSATTPVLTLFNPPSSGVNCVLWYAGATFSVAFAAASAVHLAANTNTAAATTTGTATTAHRNLLLGSSNGCKATPLLAATLPAAPVAVATLGMGLTGAITTVPQLQTLERWFDGGIVLKPNTAVSIQTSTASGASGTWCEFIWEEVPE